MSLHRCAFSIALLLSSAACGSGDGGPVPADAADDAGGREAGLLDSGLVEGGPSDGGLADGGLGDGGLGDGALGDGALGDGALGDGGLGDGALGDGALGDGAVADAGLPIDGGVDAAPGSCGSNLECARAEYCRAPACDAAGVCAPRPDFCPAVFDPVCGCDRRTYGNGCEAAAAGVNVAARGECLAACLLRPRASCCFGDADCSGGAKCYGARCIAGAEGVCKSGAELRVGECWGDIDCGSGRLCVGSSICPCGAFCFAPDAPGTCT